MSHENENENENQTLLDVQGMSCPSCIRHIEEALSEVDGVSDVDVRLREGRVLVRHAGIAPSATNLVEALREAGYESIPTPGG